MDDAATGRLWPPEIELDRPSVARVYDYYLGGTANWAVDRDFAERVITDFPLVPRIARANRVFLNRVVRHLARAGVRQFLDIGAGVPTAGNTHQAARRVASDCRVVYVDNEPVAVAHAEMLLAEEPDQGRCAVVLGDLREPDRVWADACDTGVLDPTEPVALLLLAVLHVHQAHPVTGEDIGAECVARYRELLPSGSYLAISHITDEGVPADVGVRLAQVKGMYDRSSSSRAIWRSQAEIAALMGDFDLVAPGMVWTPQWHPEETGPDAPQVEFATPSEAVVRAGLGRKR